jgi:Ca2+/Na+ antiporter
MTGFFLGLAVCAFLTMLTVASIWFARRLSGPTSLGVIQGGMLLKLMMGGILSMAIIKFADVNLWAYALTVGAYVCMAMPVIAYFMVKQDFEK